MCVSVCECVCVSVYTLRWGYLKVWIKHLTKLLHSCSPRTYTNTLGCLSYFCTLTIWSHSWLHHTPTTVFSSMLSLCSTKHTLRITCSRCTTAHFIHSFHFMMGQRRIRLLEHLFLFQPIHSLSFLADYAFLTLTITEAGLKYCNCMIRRFWYATIGLVLTTPCCSSFAYYDTSWTESLIWWSVKWKYRIHCLGTRDSWLKFNGIFESRSKQRSDQSAGQYCYMNPSYSYVKEKVFTGVYTETKLMLTSRNLE